MRQVNRDELIVTVRFAIGRLSAANLRDLGSGRSEDQARGRAMAAGQVVDALSRYEVLSSTRIDHPAGDGLFTSAASRGLPGVDLISGIVPQDVE